MFWAFLVFAALAVVFAKLGAMSVWLTILKGGLMLALFALVVLGIVLLWRQVFSIRTSKRLDQGSKYD